MVVRKGSDLCCRQWGLAQEMFPGEGFVSPPTSLFPVVSSSCFLACCYVSALPLFLGPAQMFSNLLLYRFVEEKSSFEYGQVNHALAAATRTLVKEYMILITQLEHLQRQGLLSLQKLWFYIQPTMRTMEILASLGEELWWLSCSLGQTCSTHARLAF